ncbi:MAG: glycosyltransferase [Patescibacteria group bacterium]|nr:glycosyltransferase [Patescibacteria group bacterium]MDD4443875.1 glycosyltransferase [Patescibacteria group bacterium]NCU39631.1 glycosyltransferase [Candidatus Falkowbacteria bacterium]
MKICLINNLLPPYNRGGAEKVLIKMATDLKQKNDVFIITTRPHKPDLGINSDFRTLYIKSNYYNLYKKNIIYRLFWQISNIYSFKQFQEILHILNTEKPDLVITHNLMGLGHMSALAISQLAITHHHFLHDIQLLHPSGLMFYSKERILNSLPAKIYQKLSRKFIGSPDLIISPSNWLLQEHLRRGFFPTSKTEIRPFTETIEDSDKTTPSGPKKNLFFAGQIEKHKGIIFLIKAFLKLAPDDFTLKIAGTGSLLKKAKKIAKNDKRITFFGNLDKAVLKTEMKKSDLLIVPSSCYENSPLIISEARALKVPVLASRIGGIPEAVGKDDKLFTPLSASDLFAKIKDFNK